MSTTLAKRARMLMIAGAVFAGAAVMGGGATAAVTLASHHTAMHPAAVTAPASPKPTRKVAAPARPAPTPTKTIYVTPPAPAPSPSRWYDGPATPAPAPSQPQQQFTNAEAVVDQYYQDLTNQDWQDAWALGGSNIAAQNGQTYDSWVSGYTTTTRSISITDWGDWNDGQVWCDISAVQLGGSVNTYYGTYQVSNGIIVSAHITQTS